MVSEKQNGSELEVAKDTMNTQERYEKARAKLEQAVLGYYANGCQPRPMWVEVLAAMSALWAAHKALRATEEAKEQRVD